MTKMLDQVNLRPRILRAVDLVVVQGQEFYGRITGRTPLDKEARLSPLGRYGSILPLAIRMANEKEGTARALHLACFARTTALDRSPR